MGLYLVFEKELPDIDVNTVSGDALWRDIAAVDAIAEQENLSTLSTFIDNRSMLEEILGDEEALPDLPSVQWHEAVEGLSAVRHLLSYLEKHSDAVPRQPLTIIDLQTMQSALEVAQQNDARFHLCFDL